MGRKSRISSYDFFAFYAYILYIYFFLSFSEVEQFYLMYRICRACSPRIDMHKFVNVLIANAASEYVHTPRVKWIAWKKKAPHFNGETYSKNNLIARGIHIVADLYAIIVYVYFFHHYVHKLTRGKYKESYKFLWSRIEEKRKFGCSKSRELSLQFDRLLLFLRVGIYDVYPRTSAVAQSISMSKERMSSGRLERAKSVRWLAASFENIFTSAEECIYNEHVSSRVE